MRFFNYLDEGFGMMGYNDLSNEFNSIDNAIDRTQKAYEIIKEPCKNFLKNFNETFLVSGRRNLKKMAYQLPIRRDRMPKNTPEIIHKLFNKHFQKKFNKPLRSCTLFCYPERETFEEGFNTSDAIFYGSPFLIFPVGNYSIYYNKDVYDLFYELSMSIKHDMSFNGKELEGSIVLQWLVLEQQHHTTTTFEERFGVSKETFLNIVEQDFIIPILENYQETKEIPNTRSELMVYSEQHEVYAFIASNSFFNIQKLISLNKKNQNEKYIYYYKGLNLNEEQEDFDFFNDRLYRDCKYFIDNNLLTKRFPEDGLLYSGRKNHSEPFFKHEIRKDRKPKDTPENLQKLIDDLFEKKFGIRARSSSLFVGLSSFKDKTQDYGKVYLVFPIGKNFKFIYAEHISDLYLYFDALYKMPGLDKRVTIYSYELDDFWNKSDDTEIYFYFNKTKNTITPTDIPDLKDFTFTVKQIKDSVQDKLEQIVDQYEITDNMTIVPKGEIMLTNTENAWMLDAEKYYDSLVIWLNNLKMVNKES